MTERGPVVLTIVPNEVAAEVVCCFLRTEGIRCDHRITNIGAGSWDGVPNAGGAREVLVDPAEVEVAREASRRPSSASSRSERVAASRCFSRSPGATGVSRNIRPENDRAGTHSHVDSSSAARRAPPRYDTGFS